MATTFVWVDPESGVSLCGDGGGGLQPRYTRTRFSLGLCVRWAEGWGGENVLFDGNTNHTPN
jgi:hypothetical protein